MTKLYLETGSTTPAQLIRIKDHIRQEQVWNPAFSGDSINIIKNADYTHVEGCEESAAIILQRAVYCIQEDRDVADCEDDCNDDEEELYDDYDDTDEY